MTELLFGPLGLGSADLAALFLHFGVLSLLAVGGAMVTAPDMHRFVVSERAWLSDAGFTASVALAQAAPGPNVLIVAVIGWNVAGLAGATAAMAGNLLPSSALALWAGRLGERHRQHRRLRAAKAGLAPLTVGLLLTTCWVLMEPTRTDWRAMVLTAATTVLMLRTKHSPLWPIAAGAVLGAGSVV